MADKWPLANGNWSNAANWNDGTKPQAGDDVFADGKTVTIDEDATVASVRTTARSGGTAGGGFTLAAGVTLTANVIAGTTACVTRSASGADSAIVGDVTGGTGNYSYGCQNTSSGNLFITGNVGGGNGNCSFGLYAIAGNSFVTGNVSGGAVGGNTSGIQNTSGNVTIVGNVYAALNVGVNPIGTGSVTIIGNVFGPDLASSQGGIYCVSAAVVVHVTGNVYAGKLGQGIVIASAASVTVTGVCVGNDWPGSGYANAPAITNGSALCVLIVGKLQHGVRGGSPVNGPCFFANFAGAEYYVRKSDFTEGVLVDSASINNPPAITDVRAGVSYTTGGVLTGTLAVPAAGSVALGVPVDAGVGTAVLTQAAVEAGTAAATLAIRNDIAAIDWTARALLSGTVGTVTSNSDFTLVSDDLSPTDNQYRGCWLVFETGNNVSVARFIGAYTGATKRVQFTGGGVGRGAFPSDVVAGDQWRLMPTTDLVAGIFGVRPS